MTRGRDDGPKGREALEEIEARLGDLFGRLGETLGAAARRAEDAGGPLRVSSDVSIRLGGLAAGDAARETPETEDGRPAPGSAAASASPPVPEWEVEDRDGAWVVTVEVPGAAAENTSVSVADGVLALSADGARAYAAEIPFPDHADPARLETRLANGILEIRAPWHETDGGGA